MLAFPFAVKFKLLIAGLLLASALPGRSFAGVIDSTQWPFPDTISITYTLSGRFTTHLSQSVQGGSPIDSTWTHWNSETPLAFLSPYTITTFSLNDLKSIDSSGWHLSKSNIASSASLDLVLDTNKHEIVKFFFHEWFLHFQYNNYYDLVLSNLSYNKNAIDFTNNDLWRHFVSTYYSSDYQTSKSETKETFCCITGLSIFGKTLVPGFQTLSLLDFGPLILNMNRDSTFAIHNFSDTVLTVLAYDLLNHDSGFFLQDTTLHSIPAQDSGTITIRFLPTKRQTYFDTIKIVTDQEVTNSYAISLTGSVQPLQSVAPGLGLESLIQVSPNPTTDHATLRITAASNLEAVTLRIYDAAARLVVSKSFGHLSAGLNEIPIELPSTSGIYLARVTAGERAVGNLKIVVQ